MAFNYPETTEQRLEDCSLLHPFRREDLDREDLVDALGILAEIYQQAGMLTRQDLRAGLGDDILIRGLEKLKLITDLWVAPEPDPIERDFFKLEGKLELLKEAA